MKVSEMIERLQQLPGGGFVLDPAHRDIARKHGADTEGVLFRQTIPTKSSANRRT
jgi:hypothetical protein